MATTTLRRKEAINIIRHKTAFSKQQVESLIISREGGKISYAYFREIIDQLRLRAGRTAFALNNKTEWEYVERRLKETNLPAIKFVEYFCSAPETSAQIRSLPAPRLPSPGSQRQPRHNRPSCRHQIRHRSAAQPLHPLSVHLLRLLQPSFWCFRFRSSKRLLFCS